MSHAIKILLKITMLRMKSKIYAEALEQQYGFMENRGNRDATFCYK